MNAYSIVSDIEQQFEILAQATLFKSQDDAFVHHPIIQRFGNPKQALYIDPTNMKIEDVDYGSPLIFPLYNGRLELVQSALLQDQLPVKFAPQGNVRGFTYLGNLEKDKPLIITHNLEAFFKIAQTTYAVVLVVSTDLCRKKEVTLKKTDYMQIEGVIKQLSQSGFQYLYMPVRPEHIDQELYKKLEQNTEVIMLNQCVEQAGILTLCELYQEDLPVQVQAFLDDSIQLIQSQSKWKELIPLNPQSISKSVAYPIQSLPSLARAAAQAIAEYVQAPIAMAAQSVIGAMTHIAQAQVNAPNEFDIEGEPCSLFLLTEGQSGSRKSTTRGLSDKAIAEYDRKQFEQFTHSLEQWKTLIAGVDKKEREAYCTANPPPHDPITRFTDITLESLAGLYIDGIVVNASIASDEAGQFFSGHTMKSDTRNSALGTYTKLFDDGSIERTRSKANLNGSGRAYNVRLTINLQGQREVLVNTLKDPVMRGQGFLPRFILAIPENLAGTRFKDVTQQNLDANLDPRLLVFWARCTELLISGELNQNGRRVLAMNEQAKLVYLHFYNEIEGLQAKGQCFEYLQAFASRASQLARRLATVFAFFEGKTEIDAEVLLGACTIIRHSLNEWLRYIDIESADESNAERLIKWLIAQCYKEGGDRLEYSDVQTSCPRPMQKDGGLLKIVLQQLEDTNHIQIKMVKRKRYVVLNPFLLGNMTK